MPEEGGVPEGKRVLRDAFKRLEREVPEGVARALRWLRHPKSRLVRIPVGALFIIGGFFSFLPVLGIWMLPLGLLLIAYDVPFLRKPVGRFTIWGAEKWAAIRRWLDRKRSRRFGRNSVRLSRRSLPERRE
jgi:hypothetical protein